MAYYHGKHIARDPNGLPSKYTTEKDVSSLWLLICLWLAGVIPALLLHISTTQSTGLLLSVLFALISALVLYALALLLPWRKLSFVITIFYSVLCFALCAFWLIYDSFSDDLAFEMTVEHFLRLLGMAAPTVLLCIFGRHLFRFRAPKHRSHVLIPTACAAAVTILVLFGMNLFASLGTDIQDPTAATAITLPDLTQSP